MPEQRLTAHHTVTGQTKIAVRNLALRYHHKVVVTRTYAGTYTGYLISNHPTMLRLRIYSNQKNRFIVIRIPFSILFAIYVLK